MATRKFTFLIKADNGKECVMRLPVDQYGGITSKGFAEIRQRFYDGSAKEYHHMAYTINLEAFSNGRDLIKAIESYYKNEI